MKNNPKLLLYIAAAFLAFVLWQKWQIANLPPAPAPTTASVPAATDAPQGAPGSDVPAATSGTRSDIPGDTQADTATNGAVIHVKTDVLELDIANKGGTIVDTTLPANPENKNGDKPLALLHQ